MNEEKRDGYTHDTATGREPGADYLWMYSGLDALGLRATHK